MKKYFKNLKKLVVFERFSLLLTRIKGLKLSNNFGQQIALSSGLKYAKGDNVIIMDSDLQNPIEVIPLIIKNLEENNDIVYTVSKTKNNLLWLMPNLNYQNFLGNIYLSGVDNIFLKKKIGKNKFSKYQSFSSILVSKSNIIFSDDTGTIFSISETGKVIWKKNIYRKAYKKIYKKLFFLIYESNIYVADNIGFVYSIRGQNFRTLLQKLSLW